jgi:uncharacterized repeat protein (TIGR03803 family)
MKHRRSDTLIRVSSLLLAIVTFACTVWAAGPKYAVIYRFRGGTDGSFPEGALISDHLGNLYGTTTFGGIGASCQEQGYVGCGTVFRLHPPAVSGGAWTETVLYRFRGGSDGAGPESSLIADANGNLYGTTVLGGTVGCLASNGTAVGCGTVFELVRPRKPGGAWSEKVLYRFKGVPSGQRNGDGAEPNGIVSDLAGNLYGSTDWGGSCVTNEGGTICFGSVFKLAPSRRRGGAWRESMLHRFSWTGENNPHGGLILDKDGNLYGTTYVNQYGGSTVFELVVPHAHDGSWKKKTLYEFKIGSDGGSSNAGLVWDRSGNLYGTTLDGGISNAGTVFQLAPPTLPNESWKASILYSFSGRNGDGNTPLASLIIDKAGNLYSTTENSGTVGPGTVFRLGPHQATGAGWIETLLHSFGTPKNGLYPDSGLMFGRDGALYGTTPTGGVKGAGNCVWEGTSATCGLVFRVEP